MEGKLAKLMVSVRRMVSAVVILGLLSAVAPVQAAETADSAKPTAPAVEKVQPDQRVNPDGFWDEVRYRAGVMAVAVMITVAEAPNLVIIWIRTQMGLAVSNLTARYAPQIADRLWSLLGRDVLTAQVVYDGIYRLLIDEGVGRQMAVKVALAIKEATLLWMFK